jgi:uncharacterized membrane protein required for colicin V production
MIAVMVCSVVTMLLLAGLIAGIAVEFARARTAIMAAMAADPFRPAIRLSVGLRVLPA